VTVRREGSVMVVVDVVLIGLDGVVVTVIVL
jgi:hypothetical protein